MIPIYFCVPIYHSQVASGKQEGVFHHVKTHICTRLDRIDELLVRGEYKAKIYQNYLLPSCRFILTVHDI